ncbi:MAG: rod shape-determining protein RodA [Dysgonamonadaceae bacterium]|jgi:rod shape determining protein RodA|nr:rod shape-determining protein RodA [Dysgonamonadaceae bacterium]
MLYRRTKIGNTIDWFTVILYLILVIAGWFSIYAATYDYDQKSILDLSGRAGMQMIWILSSLLIGISLLLIEKSWYETFAFWIYLLIIALLIITVFIAPEIKGSRSWLVIGPIRIQPAEFAKFATALIVAKVMGSYHFKLMKSRSLFVVLGFIFLPVALILLQKETGSALMFLAFVLVLYREGMPGAVLFSGFAAILLFVVAVRYSATIWYITPAGEFLGLAFTQLFLICLLYNYPAGRRNIKYILYGILGAGVATGIASLFVSLNGCWVMWLLLAFTGIFFFVLFIKYRASTYLWIILFAVVSVGFLYSVDYVFDEVLQPHQKTRIEVTLGMVDDPSGAGYNVNQSKIAIGSGGLTGKGYMNGTQTKLKYVPEQDTDFIFCTIGEERGFIGSALILILFLALIIRIIVLAERQYSAFNRIYGYSVAVILFIHLVVNIGMVIGITPVIGIPLPFFSYGGSSLWAFTLLLFVFLRIDTSREYRL